MAKPALKVVDEADSDKEPQHGDGDDGGAFAVGTQVTLKSGGEWMTVVGIDEETGFVICAWFSGTDLCSVPLPIDALVTDED